MRELVNPTLTRSKQMTTHQKLKVIRAGGHWAKREKTELEKEISAFYKAKKLSQRKQKTPEGV